MTRIWMNGDLVDQERAAVSVFDHGLLYGDGCFEGIRAYGGRIFKLETHLDRMYTSAEKIRLEPAYAREQIANAMYATMEANGLSDAYIRLVFTRGAGTLGLNPFLCPRSTAFIIADTIQLYPDELYQKGLKVIVANRPRIPIACLDPAIKSLNYLNNILAKIEGIDEGVLEAIMLNIDGYVAECTGDNIFLVNDGRLITPSKDAGILHGITREFVIDELAPDMGYQVQERLFHIDEVFAADEVFLTGTAAEIIGVTQVDDRTIGEGSVGPVTNALQTEFRRRVAEPAHVE